MQKCVLILFFAGLSGPAASGPRPSTLQDIAQALGLPVVEGGTEGPGTGRPKGPVDVCVCPSLTKYI